MSTKVASMVTVGCRSWRVDDPGQAAPLVLAVLYPATEPEQPESVGPYPLSVAWNAAVHGARRPLVVISHGTGGSPWTHRGLAASLARAGFVVALPEHTGNSRADNSLAGTPANLANRPRHVRLSIDAVLQDPAIGGAVAGERVGVVGHSLGGYTALAVAGGRPSSLPGEEPDGHGRAIPVERDARVAALVLLAPALPWLMADDALRGVDVPMLVRMGELDEIIPPAHGRILLEGLPAPTKVDFAVVRGAGHFSFQSPFPPAMTRPEFPPSQDPPGFDRAAYQAALNRDVEAFLKQGIVHGHTDRPLDAS